MKIKIQNSISIFSHLVFPNKCVHCETELLEKERFICNFCESTISFTYFENLREPSRMDKLFWGKLPIETTYSLMNFEEKTVVQSILHTLKYQNNPTIGIRFGERVGLKIKEIQLFDDVDALLPVPIHPKKEFKRGYNQAWAIAKGISNSSGIPVIEELVHKLKHTESQTKKSLWERWLSSENTFSSARINSMKHIALVDDVLTTGATLERLALSILEKNPNLKISLITLAITK